MKTIYVSIGNSDDKLTQKEWADFQNIVDIYIQKYAERILGCWYSDPRSFYQNACWAFEIDGKKIRRLKLALEKTRADFKQDSIAWAEATTTLVLMDE